MESGVCGSRVSVGRSGFQIIESNLRKIIVWKASGVSDLVQSGYNGILTREDTDEYAKVLGDFLRGEYDRLTMGQNAFETALRYREESVAIQAATYYNTIKRQFGQINWVSKAGDGRKNGKQISYFSG